MNIFRTLLFLMLCMNATIELIGQESNPNTALTCNPFGIIGSLLDRDAFNINLTLEKTIDANKSFALGIECKTLLLSNLTTGTTSYDLTYSWYGLQPEIRYYPKIAPKKFFLGLMSPLMLVRMKYYVNDEIEDRKSGALIGLAVRIGYKFGNRIIFEPSMYVGAGALLLNNDIDFPYGLYYMDSSSFLLGINLKFGYFLKK